MRTVYTVTIRDAVAPGAVGHVYHFPASNPHYAVRECLFLAGKRGELSRGWKRLEIMVERP